MKSDKYGERRGAAFGLAGVVKGFGISSLKKFGIATVLREGLADRFVFHCCFSNLFSEHAYGRRQYIKSWWDVGQFSQIILELKI